ncbi:histone-lysine N-methyltransferase SUVR4 isoform X1 [Vigna radiata var. radiata]|uniref:Histone-lysine N-methyltransferase SUVR4 isoform X1 n=1 Tax=Vigna radiata var. radiata TaxID=3916 RepID=A0A1S3TCX5_VIGRR|nr:histone-lysine N-methyltransferase SUVR4 isoform X1 [Vigna radiata var. radiata]
MAPNAGAEKAFSFMMDLGISKEEVKPVLIKLLRVYEGNWELIEDDNYRTLLEAYFDFEKEQVIEGERKPNASGHGQISTGEPFLVDGDDRVLPIMDSSSKKLSAEVKKSSSKKNIKPSQTFTEDDRPQTSSQALHSTMSEAKKTSNLPRGSAKDSSQTSARHRGQIEMNPVKPRAKKPKLVFSTNHNAGDLCVKPPSNQDQDLQSKNLVPACINNTRAYNGNITIASSSRLEEVKLSLNCESALAGLNFRIPDLDIAMKFMDRKYLSSSKTADPQFSTAKLLNDLCSIFLKLGLRKGSNSNLANTHTEYASLEERKPFNFISDMTKGSEKVKISLIDEFGGEALPKFNYIPCNIIYQSATVNISLARISDEGCCSDCSGDCLSSSLPCACARETGGEFAYTPQGLLKDEFLTACATMKTDPKDHHFVYCQECPLEKSKNEYMPERCKGHMVRKFIKECWRKCGCDMLCGNRIVQRGIACKLQVFLTREGKGWGLRTLEDLPKGTFVCEYIGEILTNMELYDRIVHESGNDRHTYPVTLDADWGSEKGLKDEEALCLDATYNGNVGRFINHRCYDANLIDIPVEIESPDHHYYHLAFFTNRNVSAYEELTWDYGIDFDDKDHPIKAFRCSCGSAFCHDKKQKGKGKIKKSGS